MPVTRLTTIRILLSVINQHKLLIPYILLILQMDLKTAFLNGLFFETIYMKQPKWFVRNDTTLCPSWNLVSESLREWKKVFNDILLSLISRSVKQIIAFICGNQQRANVFATFLSLQSKRSPDMNMNVLTINHRTYNCYPLVENRCD